MIMPKIVKTKGLMNNEKSNYNAWLQSKAQQDPKLKKALQLMKKSK